MTALFNPFKIVVLTYSNGHIYRHDFYKNWFGGLSHADEFIEIFRNLNRRPEWGGVKIEAFCSVEEMPKEYQDEKPIEMYR
jgi:hypothetical protein